MTVIRDKIEVRKIFDAIIKCLKDEKNSSANARLIKVGTAKWTNGLTKRPQSVEDVYILGFKSSDRPLVINNLSIFSSDIDDKFIINDIFSHVNMSVFRGNHYYDLIGDGKILPSKFTVHFEGQEFCNPITALHVLETNEKDISTLLKVTLSSQNFDDAYSPYQSVLNKQADYAVTCSVCGRFLLKDNASPIEMILGTTGSNLTRLETSNLNKRLRELVNLEKNEVWAKKKDENKYKKIKKSSLRKSRELYSDYYPAFDYKAIQQMEIEIPKDKYDLGVYGLGSAGTAILDQVCRSNWIKNIYLCDFDRVEGKNMINQWYDRNKIGFSKISASTDLIYSLNRPSSDGLIGTDFFVETDTKKFQDTELETKSFKYVVSGFDSIEARMEFLNAILDGKIEAKYLIDCRYLDLACSIYMIDLENLEEVEFYKANLEADAELIKIRNEKEKLTREEFADWYNRKGYFQLGCMDCRKNILKEETIFPNCEPRFLGSCSCRSSMCVDYLYGLYLKSCPNPQISRTDASCVKYNYIDIYKYVGAIVFGALRKIENENEKPFALVEAETDVKGLPNCMVVRR